MIKVETILDSTGPDERYTRLHTQHWRYPKHLHQETLRHRTLSIEDQLGFAPDFSFSVSSARAIPFAKLLEEVRSDELRAAPLYWGVEQKGMSPGGELSDEIGDDPYVGENGELLSPLAAAKLQWRRAALRAADMAEHLAATGVHKSIVNRVIEPYLHVNCLVTGTTWAWLNFFGLRLDGAADPTLQILAQRAWRAWNESVPTVLRPGEWHLPYADDERSIWEAAEEHHDQFANPSHPRNDSLLEIRKMMSAARCARLSYQSFATGKRSTVEEDLDLYARLLNEGGPLHASPMEHQATPDFRMTRPVVFGLKGDMVEDWANPDLGGNLGPGWVQARKLLIGEAVAPLPEAYR
jgi:thymidylate synthase ThyX